MSYEFVYESKNTFDTKNEALSFDVVFEMRSIDEDYAEAEDLSVFIEGTSIEVKFESLSKEDQKAIEIEADKITQENAHELYYDKLIGQAEAWHDLAMDR